MKHDSNIKLSDRVEAQTIFVAEGGKYRSCCYSHFQKVNNSVKQRRNKM